MYYMCVYIYIYLCVCVFMREHVCVYMELYNEQEYVVWKSVVCATQLADGLLLKMLKYFKSYVKHFWIFPRERNCRILIGLWK